MILIDDHAKVVAKRQAEKLRTGESEQSIRQYLAECYWTPIEIDYIISIAKRKAVQQ